MREIPVALLQQILDYLQTRPYREVYQLIAALIQASRQEK